MTTAFTTYRNRFIRDRILGLIRYGILSVLGVLFIIPIYWMVVTSFKTSGEAYLFPPSFFPNAVSLEGYEAIWGTVVPFNLFIANSIIITFFSVIGTVSSSTIVAFAFARLRWWG